MASLVNCANGLRRIDFVAPDGKRRCVRLGRCNKRAAQTALAFIERVVSDNDLGRPHDAETTAWIISLAPTLLARLQRVGLVGADVGAMNLTLGELIGRFVGAANVKPSTFAAYKQATSSLLAHFGAGLPIRDITPMSAAEWRKSLADSGLAPATQAKRVFVAKAIFKRAIRWGLLARSPFDGLRAGSQTNPKRSVYVPRDITQRVLDACPDDQWRAIIALARFVGLRVPSEIVGLTWGDVDWDRGRLTIRSPKTERHADHAVRIAPLAPEVRGILLRLFERAQPGEELIVPRLQHASTNLRTHLHRIIERAGVTPWPRLFQNLRASCATDWVERFPAHTVAHWLGHSPMIAAQHYLQVRDQHFDDAAGLTDGNAQQKAQHNAQQTAPAGDGQRRTQDKANRRKPLLCREIDHSWQSVETPDKMQEWAILDSNQ